MRGNEKVIEQLNAALSSEMTAVVQYMVQAETCESWGYSRLAGLTKARAIEEMHHAEHLIERIIFLDGTPDVAVPLTPKIGKNVQEHLKLDYEDEEDAVKQYNASAKMCREAGDAGSKDLFESMITDEERHADFLEAQLHSIAEIGAGAYLAQQMKGK
ncbi:MAG: bacterioferritin [Candidatus Korobacteraceae bacterium]